MKFKIKPGGPGEPSSEELAKMLQDKLDSGDLVLKSPDGKPLTLEPGSFKSGPAEGGVY